jgi:hypothetical protein
MAEVEVDPREALSEGGGGTIAGGSNAALANEAGIDQVDEPAVKQAEPEQTEDVIDIIQP